MKIGEAMYRTEQAGADAPAGGPDGGAHPGAAGGKADQDQAAIRGERRKLLLTIATTPQDTRNLVEAIASSDSVPLDQLYGMLEVLDIDVSAGHGELEQQVQPQPGGQPPRANARMWYVFEVDQPDREGEHELECEGDHVDFDDRAAAHRDRPRGGEGRRRELLRPQ